MKHIQVQAVTVILAAIVASSASAAASVNELVASPSAAAAIERELAEYDHLDFFPFGDFASGIGKAGKGKGAKGGKGGSNTGKSGKGKAGKASSKPTPKPGPGTPPGTQAPGTPPPTQTPGSPPPGTQTPATPPPTQTPATPPPTQSPVTVTSPPTQSPVTSPPTSSPTETEICSKLTGFFNDTNGFYTYNGFCNGVAMWNNKANTIKIFQGEKNFVELAAFFGHVLHESDALKAAREYAVCEVFEKDDNGNGYCKPAEYTGGEYDKGTYCKEGMVDACPCNEKVSESTVKPGFIEADKMFFGRGPIQLSWNYNYYNDLQLKGFLPQDVDVCKTPDVIATNEEYAWISAFSFWTTNKGRGNIQTSHEVVVGEGDFGTALDNINGFIECDPNPKPDEIVQKLQRRLNYYCLAATALEVKALLKLDGCDGLKDVYNACRSGEGCTACKDFAEQQ